MSQQDDTAFDHEKLEVYRESIRFVAWLSTLLESSIRAGDVKDQLDRASTSIPLNIAEGNGKYTPKDRCRFFDIAHGSALECAGGLMCWSRKPKRWTSKFAVARKVYKRSCGC
jgi:four helix bundle protein